MATYNPNNLSPDELVCPICFEDYSIQHSKERVPKLLFCLHTFCLGCVHSLLNTDRSLQCSICRTLHTDVIPADLPDNYIIVDHVRKQEEEQDALVAREHDASYMFRKDQMAQDEKLARLFQLYYDGQDDQVNPQPGHITPPPAPAHYPEERAAIVTVVQKPEVLCTSELQKEPDQVDLSQEWHVLEREPDLEAAMEQTIEPVPENAPHVTVLQINDSPETVLPITLPQPIPGVSGVKKKVRKSKPLEPSRRTLVPRRRKTVPYNLRSQIPILAPASSTSTSFSSSLTQSSSSHKSSGSSSTSVRSCSCSNGISNNSSQNSSAGATSASGSDSYSDGRCSSRASTGSRLDDEFVDTVENLEVNSRVETCYFSGVSDAGSSKSCEAAVAETSGKKTKLVCGSGSSFMSLQYAPTSTYTSDDDDDGGGNSASGAY